MSTSGREFTDEALNRVLDLWLDGGPKSMADDSLGTALRAVAVTPQRRWRGRLAQFSGASPLIPVSLTLAGIAVAVALGIGIGSLLPPAGTEASPTPEPSGPPSGSVIYTNTEDGYELTVPASWTPGEMFSFDDPSGTMQFGTAYSFGGASPFGALTVSIGTPDGTVNVCAPTLCHQIVAKTIDDLDDAVTGHAGGSENVTETAVELSLDGEPARLERIEFGAGVILMGPQFHHLFAFHEGRPIILSFDVYAYGIGHEAVNDIAWVYGLIDSFHFFDEAATPAPSPEPSEAAEQSTVQTVALPRTGFSIDTPGTWWTRVDSETDARVGGPGGEIEVRLGTTGELGHYHRRGSSTVLPPVRSPTCAESSWPSTSSSGASARLPSQNLWLPSTASTRPALRSVPLRTMHRSPGPRIS